MLSPSDRRNLPGLDGLRGTAILGVLICHYASMLPRDNSFVGLLGNGWIGVDLFFVISGFLITGILLDSKESPRYFRNFYARRTLRIFPLYYGFLFVVLCVLLVVKFAPGATLDSIRAGSRDGLKSLWSAQPWLWSYTGNFWIGRPRDWSPWLEIIAPLWSLSIEEQFYLVWPIVVLLVSRRALLGICIAIIVGALGLRLGLTANGTRWIVIYMMTPTRADPLAAGALVAVLSRQLTAQQMRKLANVAGVISAALLLASSRGFNPIQHPWLTDFLLTSLAIFFAALLVWSIDTSALFGIPNRFYELRALREIGKYSYGIYIFHLPLLYLSIAAMTRCGLYRLDTNEWLPALRLIAINIPLTAIFSFLSFHLYEKRFLKLKRHFPQSTSPTTSI